MKMYNELLSVSVESVLCVLDDTDKLLSILSDELEDGSALQDKEAWEREAFIRRLPVALALLNTVQREVDRCLTDLNAVQETLVNVGRADGEEAAT